MTRPQFPAYLNASSETVNLVESRTRSLLHPSWLQFPTLPVAKQPYFAYHQTMDVASHGDVAVSRIAAAIAEQPAPRILLCLTDTREPVHELAVAGVSPSTTSVHLHRLEKRIS